MSAEELEVFLNEGDLGPNEEVQAGNAKKNKESEASDIRQGKQTGKQLKSIPSVSEATIYKRVVQQIVPNLEKQIDQFVENACRSVELNLRNVSSSSEEFMNMSNEVSPKVPNMPEVLNISETQALPGAGERTADQRADDFIRDAEKVKASMLEVEGKNLFSPHLANTGDPCGKNTNMGDLPDVQNILIMDNDYQMIDSHVDAALCNKVENLEYVDFGKLLPKQIANSDDNRLEFVTKNRMTFLAPAADRENSVISSYIKWEQAFRVFSNIMTSKHPEKSSELLQYNHMIHTALMSYIWENVYSYDKEFRHHISRHPRRSWGVILQQAWTMLLKDRLRHDNTPFHKSRDGRDRKEICKHFNKGCCTYGLSCRYNHRCTIKKCGKYGHGAYQCRLQGEVADKEKQGESSSKEETSKK